MALEYRITARGGEAVVGGEAMTLGQGGSVIAMSIANCVAHEAAYEEFAEAE